MSTTPQLSPLEQLAQSDQQTPQTQTPPSQGDLSPLEQLAAMGKKQQQTDTSGQITNDVGNTVIVPKDGESYLDTVHRAIVQQKAMTPQQRQDAINKETATIPSKTAQTLGAAAGIGVAGPAVLAVPGEIADVAIKHLAGNVLPGMESEAAKQALLRVLPHAVNFAKTVRDLGIGAAGAGYLLKTLIGDSKK